MKRNLVEIFMGIIILVIIIISIQAPIMMYLRKVQKINLQIYTQLDSMYEEVKTLREIIQSDYQVITVTSYHPKSKGINSDGDPNRTALMKRPIPGYTLAISTELVELGWLGKKIYINGWGVGHATDRMGRSIKGKHIDICAPSLKVAKRFGVKKDVLSIVLK